MVKQIGAVRIIMGGISSPTLVEIINGVTSIMTAGIIKVARMARGKVKAESKVIVGTVAKLGIVQMHAQKEATAVRADPLQVVKMRETKMAMNPSMMMRTGR